MLWRVECYGDTEWRVVLSCLFHNAREQGHSQKLAEDLGQTVGGINCCKVTTISLDRFKRGLEKFMEDRVSCMLTRYSAMCYYWH